jgi:ubiquinone/menaquinone biosynthesis C-methylase UbiE
MFKPQVPPEHYRDRYDSHARWNSYWAQIEWVLWFKPKTVLEVGIGHGLVSWYLKNVKRLKVTTADIDPRLNPDYVCSITELSKYFNIRSFDVVLAAQVLEHLPFKYFEVALREIALVSIKGAVLTLPHSCRYIRFLVETAYKKIPFLVTVDTRMQHRPDPEHFWAIGESGMNKRRIENIIQKYFKILYSFNIFENPYHRLYVLGKKEIFQ